MNIIKIIIIVINKLKKNYIDLKLKKKNNGIKMI